MGYAMFLRDNHPLTEHRGLTCHRFALPNPVVVILLSPSPAVHEQEQWSTNGNDVQHARRVKKHDNNMHAR